MTWSRSQFLTAYDMLERNLPLVAVARKVGMTAAEVDLALWHTLGSQSVSNAIAILNAPRLSAPEKREAS